MNRKAKQKREILKAVGLVCLFILTAVLLLVFINLWENQPLSTEQPSTSSPQNTFLYGDKYYKSRENIETVLMIGLDKFDEDITENVGYNNNQQADFLMLMVIDHENKVCDAVQINRDTMTQVQMLGVNSEVAGTIYGQIALAHAYGSGKEDSCENTVTAVSELLYGEKIDHYIAVTMDAVATVNDLAGGVTVNVLDDFTGVDDTLIKGKDVTLFGEHALHYVRIRKDLEDSTNQNRMKRQQQYMSALYQKIGEAMEKDKDFIGNAVLEVAPYMTSDCSANKLSDILEAIKDYEMTPIKNIDGNATKGETYMEYYVDDNSLRETIMELYYIPEE